MTILPDWTVDRVLRNVPEAEPVLAELGITACAREDSTLGDAARCAGIEVDELLAALCPAVAEA